MWSNISLWFGLHFPNEKWCHVYSLNGRGKGMYPRKVLVAWFSVTVRSGGTQWGRSTGLLREKSNINTIDNNITKIIRTYSTRHFCRCFFMLSHSITFEALTLHIYRNDAFFRSILILQSFKGSHTYEPCLFWHQLLFPLPFFSYVSCPLSVSLWNPGTPLPFLVDSQLHLESHLSCLLLVWDYFLPHRD